MCRRYASQLSPYAVLVWHTNRWLVTPCAGGPAGGYTLPTHTCRNARVLMVVQMTTPRGDHLQKQPKNKTTPAFGQLNTHLHAHAKMQILKGQTTGCHGPSKRQSNRHTWLHAAALQHAPNHIRTSTITALCTCPTTLVLLELPTHPAAACTTDTLHI